MKRAFPTVPVRSITEYIERIKRLRRLWDADDENDSVWFRGHADVGWQLVPKLYRFEFRGSDEAEIRFEFQSRALQLLETRRVPTTEWEWYFLMQHYGAPTRLLDWTDNPLVALYFALNDSRFSGYQPNQDAAVWALNPAWLNRHLGRGIEGAMLSDWAEADPYLPDLENAFAGQQVRIHKAAAIDPPHVDRRLAAQGSRFVIFGRSHDLLRAKAARTQRGRRRQLTMIQIDHRAVGSMREDLELCGITRPLLFPDLEALCADICRKSWRKA